MARPVLYQITNVFKGRKGKGGNDSGGFDLLRLRLKHKEIKQKRQKLPTTAAEVKANTSRNFLVFTLNLEQRYEKKNFVVAFYYL